MIQAGEDSPVHASLYEALKPPAWLVERMRCRDRMATIHRGDLLYFDCEEPEAEAAERLIDAAAYLWAAANRSPGMRPEVERVLRILERLK